MKIKAYKSILLNTNTNTTFIALEIDEEVQTESRENDKHIEWVGELDVPIPNTKQLMRELFQEIKHGDREHKDWLEEKIETFIERKCL